MNIWYYLYVYNLCMQQQEEILQQPLKNVSIRHILEKYWKSKFEMLNTTH